MLKWGFDTLRFDGNWDNVKKSLMLEKAHFRDRNGAFVFAGMDGLQFICEFDPETGEHYMPPKKKVGPIGFCGHVGLIGSPGIVVAAVEIIRAYKTSNKGESPGLRSFV